MEPQSNLRLLFISLCLVVSIDAAWSRLAPVPSSADAPAPYGKSVISEVPSEAPVSPSPSEELDLSSSSSSILGFSDQPARFDDLPTNIIKATNIDFSSSLHAVGPKPELSKICDNTDHPALCLAMIVPLYNAGKDISVETVLRVAVQAGSEYAKEALSVADNLVSKPGTSPDLIGTLKDCKNSYDTAVENYAKTMDAFATKDIGTMRSVLSAVITFIGDCEDEFAEMQSQSPLSGYAEKLTDMTSNCLAIVAQMN